MCDSSSSSLSLTVCNIIECGETTKCLTVHCYTYSVIVNTEFSLVLTDTDTNTHSLTHTVHTPHKHIHTHPPHQHTHKPQTHTPTHTHIPQTHTHTTNMNTTHSKAPTQTPRYRSLVTVMIFKFILPFCVQQKCVAAGRRFLRSSC